MGRSEASIGVRLVCLCLVGWSAGCSSSDGGGGSADTGNDTSADTAGADTSTVDTGGGDAPGVDTGEKVCPAFCDDKLACTEDTCVDGECVFTPLAGSCTVDGACYTADELHPTDPCLRCDPEASLVSWSAVPDDSIPCDDGTECTTGDQCAAGVCVGDPVDCDDGDLCTDATCVDATGKCAFSYNSAPCDDGDPCTTADACLEGVCTGGGPTCDDGDACTDDACDAGACSATAKDCSDLNECTDDSCNPETGCAYDPKTGTPCEGGDLCLTGDVCNQGTCDEGTEPVPCADDGNPCTDDVCVSGVGCVSAFSDQPCDDGFACTSNDTCLASLCVGTVTGDCGCTAPEFAGQFQKATVLLVGGNGEPGAGMDVDEDPDTCAPANDCSGGVDNAMADLSSFLNPTLATAIEAGSWVTLVEFEAPEADGGPFTLHIYGGLPADPTTGCDLLDSTCEFVVLPESIGPDCAPSISIENASIQGTTLTAGGPGTVFTIGLPLKANSTVNFLIFDARVQAEVTWAADGTSIESVVGVVAGAVPKAVIFDVLSQIDEGLLGGVSIEDLLVIVDTVLVEDLDLDGDGEADAASVGLRIDTIPAVVTGLKSE